MQKEAVALEAQGCKMTREQALDKAELNSHKGGDLLIMHTTTEVKQITMTFQLMLKTAKMLSNGVI